MAVSNESIYLQVDPERCYMLKHFIHVQVLLEVAITAILVEEENTSACQTIRNTTSTRTVIK